jgi:hypothetical protein
MPLDDFRSVHLPYCLQRLADGSYVVLNREYKPIGYRTRDHIRYEDLPILATIQGITPQMAAKLSWSGSDDLDRIMLYNDGCIPTASAEHMKRYLEKIEILAALKFKPA